MPETQMTSQYDIFKFRKDNRESINQAHVKRLADSISARNLLELRPISVNAKMEVIDGQHRLLAAQMLGVPIYYMQDKKLSSADIILMNISQPWGQMDYLNYYCSNDFEEYKKLASFMKKNGISIKIALNITMGHKRDSYNKFKLGQYTFSEEDFNDHIDICWETIDYIKKMNGYSSYTQSSRFWAALLIMIRHTNFDANKWRDNLKRMVERCTAKATQADYLRLFMDIHNWRNNSKLELVRYGE